MKHHDLVMLLDGPEVRRRAARLAPGPSSRRTRTRETQRRPASAHLEWLANRASIPVGTIQNATRSQNPQSVSLPVVYAIAAAVRIDDETIDETFAAIVSAEEASSTKRAAERVAS